MRCFGGREEKKASPLSVHPLLGVSFLAAIAVNYVGPSYFIGFVVFKLVFMFIF